MKRWLSFALLFALWPLAASGVTTKRLDIESFHADILIYTDGALEVTETIRPRFTGSWNGIYRTIPIEYRTPQGFNYTLRLSLVSVTDGDGTPLQYEVSRQRHYRKVKIWVPDARDATRTVVLRYRVRNGLRFFEDYDELYWNVTGDEWGVPIEASSATVTLPVEASGVRASAFTGGYGSTERAADVTVEANTVSAVTRRRLNLREGLTLAVAWDKGAVREPGWFARTLGFLISNWPLLIPIACFGLMFWLWNTRGRDPRLRPITTRYEPPAKLSPAEVGTLLDNSPDMRDITAVLVDLAVRGFLLIEEKKESKWLGLASGTEYVFHLRKPREEWDGLLPHEREVLVEMFGGGTYKTVEMSELENKFYKALPGIRDRIFERLMANRYYDRRPDKVKKTYAIAGIIVGGLAVWGGGFVAAALGISELTFLVSGLASGAIVFLFGLIMPARTLAGTRALEEVLGFEEFLNRVESDRLERMVKTPELFEKYLPYAMALGVESRWAAAFADIYREPPNWYRGYSYGPHFHPVVFTNSLGNMTTRAASVMASAPRSSGGSGFGGGGGFSGGGFGGGGGGGF